MTKVEEDTLREAFRELGPAVEKMVMTAAEKLLEKGRDEGRREGLREGRRTQAASTLLRLLEARFGAVPASALARIEAAAAEGETLERWTARVLDAQTVDHVFDDDGAP